MVNNTDNANMNSHTLRQYGTKNEGPQAQGFNFEAKTRTHSSVQTENIAQVECTLSLVFK